MPYKYKDRYKEYQKSYRQKNRIKLSIQNKEYRKKNSEKYKKYGHEWYLKHRVLSTRVKLTEEQKKKNRQKAWQEWYLKNKDKKILDNKNWVENNKEKRNLSANLYSKKRRLSDINYKLASYLRSRLNYAVRENQKKGSAVKDLGCTTQELKLYIEKQFKEGMTWDNWGLYTWHIDHKIPLSSFDLSKREELLKACHYTNLQPLWWRDNLKKHAKII